jgi:hypothetical protein
LLLRETTTLKSLRIVVPRQEEIFARGIEENESLECLELAVFHNAARATSLFRQLRLPPTLRKLILTEASELSGLCAMLSSSSLESLKLSSCSFDRPLWRFLSEALQASSTLTSLSLDKCAFDDGATQDLVRFFNHSSPVTDLHISTSNDLSAVRLSSIIARILTSSGSTLERVRSSGASVVFRFLKEKGKEVHVLCLRVDTVSNDDFLSLANWLPRTIKLRELTVDRMTLDFDDVRTISSFNFAKAQVLRAMRQNGSLYHVTIPEFAKPVPRFKPTFQPRRRILSKFEIRKIATYCRRNQELPTLLQHVSQEMGYHSALFPMAVVAAQQSPTMAATTMLIGLLAADENGIC